MLISPVLPLKSALVTVKSLALELAKIANPLVVWLLKIHLLTVNDVPS